MGKSTLCRTIDGLVNTGLVERVPHPTDRRFNFLSLTAKGQEVVDRINHSNDYFYRKVFQDIEAEGHDEVIDNFEKLVLATRKYQNRFDKEKGAKV